MSDKNEENKKVEDLDVYQQLRKFVNNGENATKDKTAEVNRQHNQPADGDGSSRTVNSSQSPAPGNDDESQNGVNQWEPPQKSSSENEQGYANREQLQAKEQTPGTLTQNENKSVREKSNPVLAIIKPDGHWNKPLIVIGIVVIGFLCMLVFRPGEADPNEIASNTSLKADSIPENSSGDMTSVNRGSVTDSPNGNSNTGGILDNPYGSNTNTNTAAPNGAANSNVAVPQTTTEVKTYTTVEPQPGAQTGAQQGTSQPSSPNVPQPVQRAQINERFTVDLEDSPRNQTQNPEKQNVSQVQDSDVPVRPLRVAPGARIQLSLREPFRSGIETKVQAVSTNNIKGIDGRTLIPAGAIFELTFRPEEVNSRVLARNVARVFLSDGSIGEISGIVKGEDGYAGLGGKLIKEGGQGLGSRIINGVARVGGRMIGQTGSVGGEVENEIRQNGNGGYDANIYRSSRIVEVRDGTRFYFLVGTPE